MKSLADLAPEDRGYAEKFRDLCNYCTDMEAEFLPEGLWTGVALITWEQIEAKAREARIRNLAREEIPVTPFELSNPENRKSRERIARRKARVQELLNA